MSFATLQSQLHPFIAPILAFELILGGQARLCNLTPSLHRRAMLKAPGTRDALPFIPFRDATRHTNFIGFLMCLAGALVAAPKTRVPWGSGLTLALTSMGIWSQWRMGIPYWLPVLNSVLALLMWAGEV